MTPPTTIIYHANCPDGMAAAWATRQTYPHANLMPLAYEDPLPFDALAGHEIVMADISWPLEEMVRLANVAHSLAILDHHESAIRKLLRPGCFESGRRFFNESDLHDDFMDAKATLWATFDLDRSGAGIVWEWLIGGEPPWWLRMIEDYDLWRFSDADTRAACAFIHAVPRTIETYDWLDGVTRYDSITRRSIVQMGAKMLEREAAVVDVLCDNAAIVYWRVPALKTPLGLDAQFATAVVEAPAFLASAVAERLRKDESLHLVAIWSWEGGETLRRKVSLRASEAAIERGVNASRVAEAYGGGGHPGAAGFVCHELPWEA